MLIDKPNSAEERSWKLVLFFKDHGAKFENYQNATALVANTLRAVRNETLDEAAKVSESLKDKYKECAVGYHLGSAHMAVDDIPKAIRALKTSEGGKRE